MVGQARQYLVVKLDLVGHAALVRPVRVGSVTHSHEQQQLQAVVHHRLDPSRRLMLLCRYYTSSRNHTDVNLLKRLESTDDGCISSGCAQVEPLPPTTTAAAVSLLTA